MFRLFSIYFILFSLSASLFGADASGTSDTDQPKRARRLSPRVLLPCGDGLPSLDGCASFGAFPSLADVGDVASSSTKDPSHDSNGSALVSPGALKSFLGRISWNHANLGAPASHSLRVSPLDPNCQAPSQGAKGDELDMSCYLAVKKTLRGRGESVYTPWEMRISRHLYTFVEDLGSGAFGLACLYKICPILASQAGVSHAGEEAPSSQVVCKFFRDGDLDFFEKEKTNLSTLRSLLKGTPEYSKHFISYLGYSLLQILTDEVDDEGSSKIVEVPCLMTGFINGDNLHVYLKNRAEAGLTGVPGKHFLRLARELTEAIACLNSEGLSHRDLKPDNIMMEAVFSTEGKWIPRVVIIDIGLMSPSAEKLTEESVCCAVCYRDPANTFGEEEQAKMDVFAVGVILFKMYTGKRLFQARNEKELILSWLQHLGPLPKGYLDRFNVLSKRLNGRAPSEQDVNDLRSEYEKAAGEMVSKLGKASLRREPKALRAAFRDQFIRHMDSFSDKREASGEALIRRDQREDSFRKIFDLLSYLSEERPDLRELFSERDDASPASEVEI